MSDEMDSINNLEDLMEHFTEKLSLLNYLLVFRDLDKTACSVIVEANHGVQELRMILNNMIDRVQKAKSKTSACEEEVMVLKELNRRIEYVKGNVPSDLSVQVAKRKAAMVNNIPQPVVSKTTCLQTKKSAKTVPSIECLTAEAFDAIPKYMKGRLSLAKINEAISCFNNAIRTKYKLLSKPRHQLTPAELLKYNEFLDQEVPETTGQHFCIDNDLKCYGNLTINKTLSSILVILRHCKRIVDVRSQGLVRHCVV